MLAVLDVSHAEGLAPRAHSQRVHTLSNPPCSYIHRSGRTGRAGSRCAGTGLACPPSVASPRPSPQQRSSTAVAVLAVVSVAAGAAVLVAVAAVAPTVSFPSLPPQRRVRHARHQAHGVHGAHHREASGHEGVCLARTCTRTYTGARTVLRPPSAPSSVRSVRLRPSPLRPLRPLRPPSAGAPSSVRCSVPLTCTPTPLVLLSLSASARPSFPLTLLLSLLFFSYSSAQFERIGAPQPADMARIAAERSLALLGEVEEAVVGHFR